MEQTYWKNGIKHDVELTPEEIAAIEESMNQPEPTPEPTPEERIKALEDELAALRAEVAENMAAEADYAAELQRLGVEV